MRSLDLFAARCTEGTSLTMVSSLPEPFPPEPFGYPVVCVTKAALAQEDRIGMRGLLLDRFGVGFNS
ncbi:hypothetical protein [Streptomyces sp. NPDC088794]|uniref:hypothetical protein n=1 Tax=Streptomyces sp. NPDC088794 TaxID=3365902 RepID=UPI0038036AA9